MNTAPQQPNTDKQNLLHMLEKSTAEYTESNSMCSNEVTVYVNNGCLIFTFSALDELTEVRGGSLTGWEI